MALPPDQTPAPVAQENVETYCYGHPNRPTKLQCSRCDRYICGQCAIPASVGQHCPECVAEARKSAPKVRTAMAVNAPATRAIIAITVGVYVLQIFTGDLLIDRFASSTAHIADGQFYRLLTSVFLHAPLQGSFSILHIAFNMYILSIYGPHVEQTFGTARFVFLYFATGFVASAVSYNLNDCIVGYGASGAVFGIVGVLLLYLYNRRSSTIASAYLRDIGIFIAINLMFGFTLSGIDNFAHIGGLLGGIALAAGFDRGLVGEGSPAPPRQIATSVVVLGVAVALVIQRTATFDLSACFA
ncbi:MAG TPA: rhomboid family intramembrane serine protease [Actinomycetota bacterium]|nr:rhomboid family intramembrane serine protease [Actinomycetota bacterium]